jgi:hypothetical protein
MFGLRSLMIGRGNSRQIIKNTTTAEGRKLWFAYAFVAAKASLKIPLLMTQGIKNLMTLWGVINNGSTQGHKDAERAIGSMVRNPMAPEVGDLVRSVAISDNILGGHHR